MFNAISLVGWAHTKFGRLTDETLEGLIGCVAHEAIAHAGVSADEIDEVVISHFNQGMDRQGFPASLPIQGVPELRFKPSTRVENACASGSAAIHLASKSIRAGDARHILVVGVEKMTASDSDTVRNALASASYVREEGGPDASFAGLFGRIARAYFERYGDCSDALALIAAKNHRNGASNPYAHIRKDLGYDFCRTVSAGNPMVASPLRRTDCSMVSDGAAAIVLGPAGERTASGSDIRIRAMTHVNDVLPMSVRDMTQFQGAAKAWALALDRAKISLGDLDFVESHDCFTIAELMQYEAMGLAAPGRAAHLVMDGVAEPQGRLPINLSGGLKAKGHPIDATGVSMHVLVASQLAGHPAGLAADNPRLGGIFNMGGAGVANYCSILERVS